jgi:hypothetical protein
MGYWGISLSLIVFGILGSLSIGLPFLLIGLTLVILNPLRHRPRLFWPLLLAMIAYNLAFWFYTPFYCTVSSSTDGTSSAACSSLLGIAWPASAGGLADPGAAFYQANLAGLAAAVLTFIVTGLLIRRSRGNSGHVEPKVGKT